MSSSPRRELSKLPWSRSKLASPESKSSQSEKSSSTKLSLNLFFGFMSKKPSSPVAQHPQHTILASPAPILPITRPPSKSISSVRSRVDSIGPKTPTDSLRESRQSLLTLSDSDPFAGRGVTVITSPQSAIGHSRLSIYSNNSLPDVGRPESKAYLCSPTSPSSCPLSPDSLTPSSPASLQAGRNSPSRLLSMKRSVDFPRKGASPFPDPSFGVATEEVLSKSGSTLTLTEKHHFVSALPARTTRARGMTESAMSFVNFRGTVRSSPGTSRGLSRQSSMSRLASPPSTPPSHELPPPPTSASDASGDEDNMAFTESASSSCLSFASISSDVFLTYSPRYREKTSSSGTKDSSKSPVHGPKRVTSHNSLMKPDVPGCLGEYCPDEEKGKDPEKSPRKQRSFHHPRLPSLPILNRSPNTMPMPMSLSPTQSSPNIEQRRGSNSSLPSRKRLFSGPARRPSTSQGISVDDDARSTVSCQSEQNVSPIVYRLWARPVSCSPSIGDDGENDEPSSPQFSNKYTPQHIISPAEMAQVEASVELVTSPRARGLSISTITSRREMQDESPMSSASAVLDLTSVSKSSTFPSWKSSFVFSNSEYSRVQPPTRPQTSQANMGPGFNEHQPFRPSDSPPLSLMSLPPPPRPRQRTLTALSSSKSMPIDVQSSLQPPPHKTLVVKTSMEQFLCRHSLLRKPSFLEIDDDGDKNDNGTSPGDSFLDLTRESLDANGN